MADSRRPLSAFSQRWPAAWLVTSAILVAALLQIESGWFVAAFYLGLNAITVLYVRLGVTSRKARPVTVYGWCVAVQLPAMLWLHINRRRAPEWLHHDGLADDDRRASADPKP